MSADRVFIGFFILVMIAAVVLCIANIVWAVECGNKGGAYIVPQNSFPVCVQGVK